MPNISILHESASRLVSTSIENELYSKDRVVFLEGEINRVTAHHTIVELSYLDGLEEKDIHLYINSQGGSISDGLAIVDCMRSLRSPVHTHAFGLAASMGAVILACGEPGHRSATPHSDILIHQPLVYGAGGQASDIKIVADSIIQKRKTLNDILASATGRSLEEIETATDRDNYLTADEVKGFGLIDFVETEWMGHRAVKNADGDGNESAAPVFL